MGELDVIEPVVRAMVPIAGRNADPEAQITENAEHIIGLVQDLVHCAAISLTTWNPLSGTHRHETLANKGYSLRTLEHVNDAFVQNNRAFALAHLHDPRSLRWCDYREDWSFDFSDTESAQDYLIPDGFQEGSTMCLRLPDGRYTGAIHMSWVKPPEATSERRMIVERFRPLLAELCDQLRIPRVFAETMAPGAFALVISPNGSTFCLPNRSEGPHLGENGALRHLIMKPQGRLPERFLWPDDEGMCHRVTITPCHGNARLVTEELTTWPYGLSMRELQVLYLVAGGASNPEISEMLFISARTVSTHVEHILDKMGCFSRAKLAAMAVSEGLLLAESP
ncbi:helix-turn-helix transcriptional regulator [Methyloligella sp. 2.7D]|uniref:response regulator transcription factor n=1 Tax=unclassified Methyloligella TaxID=2625955 RepID=UPI00157E18E1|nr:helix-turn-helix transcriptional regulator [Methyloligella sp. GL2]QKP78234.1 helix-turn-helix transcriptional regulator [Methyloligella sp. GL2]